MFKKVGQAQQLALSVLADHNKQKLSRDPHAHKDCPEYWQVKKELAERERKVLRRIKAQHDLKVQSATRVHEGNIYSIEERAKVSLT